MPFSTYQNEEQGLGNRREKSKLTVAYFLEETNINVINMFPLNLSLSLSLSFILLNK